MEKEKQKIELYIPKEKYEEFMKLFSLNLGRIGIHRMSNNHLKAIYALRATNCGRELPIGCSSLSDRIGETLQ
jgi:hypothetical protein